jgi:TRAP-type C4-dicarboxylate transport system permease small subunit
MLNIILQNANEGTASGLFGALLNAINLILSVEEVRLALGWMGAMLTVGACILAARFLVASSVAQANKKRRAEQARDATIASPQEPKE